jgi:hypothetical protein
MKLPFLVKHSGFWGYGVVTLEEVFRKFGFGVVFGKFAEMFFKADGK